MHHEETRLPAFDGVLGNEVLGQLEIERIDFHPILQGLTSPIEHRASPSGSEAATSALILQPTAQIVMAMQDTPTGTRGIEPAKEPLAPTPGAPGEPPPVVV